jgi:hypothetical protein
MLTLLAWPSSAIFHPFDSVEPSQQAALIESLKTDELMPEFIASLQAADSQPFLRWAEVPSGEWMLDLETLLCRPMRSSPPPTEGP